MRNKYWNFYAQIKMDEYYYSAYLSLSSKIEFWINIFVFVVSFSGIISWKIWSSFSTLWAVIIGASQILNAVRHLFPFVKRINALNYLLPEMSKLINEIDRDWSKIDLGEFSDTKINDLVFHYQSQYDTLLSKYVSDDLLSKNQYCTKIAEEEKTAYFKQKYNIDSLQTVEEVYK